MPLTYQINILLDQQALQRIYAAGQSITIVSPVSSFVAVNASAGAQPTVAWLAFRPFMNNVITWPAQLSVYATVTPPNSPAVILVNSMTPAQPGGLYTLAQGYFSGASGQGASYNVSNQMSGYNLYFGLVQSAQVNGAQVVGPLNAVPVLEGQQATFTPTGQISIFLSSASQNGTVIPGVPSTALTFQITQQPVSVMFNDSTNTFYLAGTAAS